MIQSSINAVIFDFGGVLINIDYDATIQAFRNLGIQNFDEMYSQAEQSNLFDAIETGKISPDAFVSGLLEFLPENTTAEQVINAWNAMILDVPPRTITLLKELKERGYKLYMLSNTNSIHIDKAYKEWGLVSTEGPSALFDHVYLSHEMGMRKPHPEIFDYVCKEQALTPGETLFIDDSIQHIEGAKSIGLQTHFLKKGEKVQELFS